MKHLTTACWIFITIVFAVLIVIFYAGNSVIDIQLYDTYFVIEKWLLALLTLVFILFLLSLVAGILSGFSSKIFNWLLLLSGLCLAAYWIYLYLVLKK